MPRYSSLPDMKFRERTPRRIYFQILISLAFFGLLFQPGCLFKRHKPPAAPVLPAIQRIVLLPLNVPRDDADMRWVSLATTVWQAQVIQAASDLEPVPLWESLPAVLQSLGPSRTVTPEIAEFTAARLTARWAIQGQISSAGGEASLQLDFIPSKPSTVPFRYEKQSSIDAMIPHIKEAMEQFLRYLIARPLDDTKIRQVDAKMLKEIAQALDVEYGWFVQAKPGESGKLVEDLARADIDMARLLFSPTLYSVLAK